MNDRFLLVLEPAEAARLDRCWRSDHMLVAEFGPDDAVLHAYPASEDALARILEANVGVPVHPAREGRSTVLMEFHREAALLARARSAMADRRSVEAEPAEPTPATVAGEIAIAPADASAADLASGDRLVLETGADGLMVARREAEIRRPRVHWLLRDLAIAVAMLGAFALGLAGGR